MKLTYYVSIVLIIFLYEYYNNNKGILCNNGVTYDIKINYSSMHKGDKRPLAGGDSVVIGFVGDFNHDTVDIFNNNKFYKTVILTSDPKTDGAGTIPLDKWQHLKDISIRINNGPLIFVETNKQEYHISFQFYNEVANIEFYKYLPATY
ncbi:hypothetical protein [Draconibacterium mangrovi]|uniref:hypothetical protein n=1 Tax=Draconibacterium mangrovi TaxID=2697469 RepID=UPI0013D25C02|nr:hypothetical protein [Draconibacterium mangrovi]